jgi:hypothetical protein
LRRRDNALSIDTVPERPWNKKVCDSSQIV